DAVIHGQRDRLLGFDPVEQPVALQLGGSEPEKLAEAARIGAAYGYIEINLNVGCPSERVQSGAFGACLMREPELVADCLTAMRELPRVEGVMRGRAAYHEPYILLGVDGRIFGDDAPQRSADQAARDFRPWILARLAEGAVLHSITRHMLGLFSGRPGARQWRRILSEKAPGARGAQAIAIYDEALDAVRPVATAAAE